MNLLLDTHTLLWFLREPERLPVNVAEAIESAGRQAFVSMATLWEIAIKVSLDKLYLPGEFTGIRAPPRYVCSAWSGPMTRSFGTMRGSMDTRS